MTPELRTECLMQFLRLMEKKGFEIDDLFKCVAIFDLMLTKIGWDPRFSSESFTPHIVAIVCLVAKHNFAEVGSLDSIGKGFGIEPGVLQKIEAQIFGKAQQIFSHNSVFDLLNFQFEQFFADGYDESTHLVYRLSVGILLQALFADKTFWDLNLKSIHLPLFLISLDIIKASSDKNSTLRILLEEKHKEIFKQHINNGNMFQIKEEARKLKTLFESFLASSEKEKVESFLHKQFCKEDN